MLFISLSICVGDLRKEVARLSHGYQQLLGQLGGGSGLPSDTPNANVKTSAKSKKLTKGRPGSAVHRLQPMHSPAEVDSPGFGDLLIVRSDSFEVDYFRFPPFALASVFFFWGYD